MSYHEKNTWCFGVIALVAYGIYVAIIAPQLATTPVAEIDYAVALFSSIGGAIVAGIIIGITSPRGADKEDERDRRISRLGDHTGNAFITIGGVLAMILAVLKVDGFWIANVIYLCFILAATLSSITKIVTYRGGLPSW